MRSLLLLLMVFAMAASPAVATEACRCGSRIPEAAAPRGGQHCRCCEPGECHCCCSKHEDGAQPRGEREGLSGCACTQTGPRQAPTSEGPGTLAAPALHGIAVCDAILPPEAAAGGRAPCARDVRPPCAGFTLPLRV